MTHISGVYHLYTKGDICCDVPFDLLDNNGFPNRALFINFRKDFSPLEVTIRNNIKKGIMANVLPPGVRSTFDISK